MFSLFKKKSPLDKLREKRDALLKESFRLSTINRAESDKLRAEVETVELEIEKLKAEQ